MQTEPSDITDIIDLLLSIEEAQQETDSTSLRTLVNQRPDLADAMRSLNVGLDEVEQQWNALQRANQRLGGLAQALPRYPQIAGFVIQEEIGRGGMGVVVRARQARLDRDVAIKLIVGGKLAASRSRQRFHAEAQAIARLQDPNIVQIFDSGEAEGELYIVMELLEGGTLADRLHQGSLPVPEAAVLVKRLACAMQHAHQQGVVHRDLKPANILFDASGSPKIGDFGLAKALAEERELTATGDVAGSPSYMAPEQITGQGVDVTTDVYGLGAILYELLAGRPPFQGDTTADTLIRVQREDPQPPRRLNSHVPADLEAIALKCLEKSPERRYLNASALAMDLRRWLDGQPTAARPIGRMGRLVRWARREPLAATVVTLLIGGALLAAGGSWWHTVRLSGALEREQRSRAAAQEARALAEDRERLSNEFRYAAHIRLAQVAYESNRLTQSRENLQLARSLCRDREPRFEWRLLQRVYLDSRREFLYPGGSCNHAEVSPDGATLVTGHEDGSMCLWDLHSGALVQRHKAHDACINRACYTPDGKRLVTAGCDHLVRVWTADSLEPVHTLEGHAEPVMNMVISRDGKTAISATEHGPVMVWHLATGKLIAQLDTPGTYRMCLSQDGRTLATKFESQPVIGFWNLDSYELSHVLNASEGCNNLEFINDDTELVVAEPATTTWYDVETGAAGMQLSGLLGVEHVRMAHNRQLLLTSHDSGAVQAHGTSGPWCWRIAAHETAVTSLSQLPGTLQFLTSGLDGRAVIHDIRLAAASLQEPISFGSHTAAALCSRTGRVALGESSGKVMLGDIPQFGECSVLPRESTWDAGRLRFSPDGSVLHIEGAYETELRESWLVDCTPPRLLCESPSSSTRSQAYDPSWVRLGPNRAWSIQMSGNRVDLSPRNEHSVPRRFEASGAVESLAFSSDGKMLCLVSNADAVLYQTDTGQRLATMLGNQRGFHCAAFSPDGATLAIGGEGATIHLFSTVTGQELLVLKGPWGPVSGLAFSPDGDSLAFWYHRAGALDAAHDWPHGIILWQAASADELAAQGEWPAP